MSLGIVCGYRAEARIAAQIAPLVAMGWRNPDAAKQLIAKGATTLLSFGVAGGLDPELEPGALLLPDAVLVDGVRHAVSPDLHQHLTARFEIAATGSIVNSKHVLVTAREKRLLFDQTEAVATDMESGMVAKAAVEAGIAFAVIRAISDPVDHSLPRAAQGALNDAGDVDYLKVIKALLNDPFQLPDLIRTGQQNNAAMCRLQNTVPDLRALLL